MLATVIQLPCTRVLVKRMFNPFAQFWVSHNLGGATCRQDGDNWTAQSGLQSLSSET